MTERSVSLRLSLKAEKTSQTKLFASRVHSNCSTASHLVHVQSSVVKVNALMTPYSRVKVHLF